MEIFHLAVRVRQRSASSQIRWYTNSAKPAFLYTIGASRCSATVAWEFAAGRAALLETFESFCLDANNNNNNNNNNKVGIQAASQAA
jgi:hypothetical protein